MAVVAGVVASAVWAIIAAVVLLAVPPTSVATARPWITANDFWITTAVIACFVVWGWWVGKLAIRAELTATLFFFAFGWMLASSVTGWANGDPWWETGLVGGLAMALAIGLTAHVVASDRRLRRMERAAHRSR